MTNLNDVAFIAIVVVGALTALLCIFLLVYCCVRKSSSPFPVKRELGLPVTSQNGSNQAGIELPQTAPLLPPSQSERRRASFREVDIGGYPLLLFSYEQLKKATYGFSDQNLLGAGGFGIVHRGRLDDGRDVAVKQLTKDAGDVTVDEFCTEMSALIRAKHGNLVGLIGCCVERSKLIIVLDFIPNGNLSFHLHQKSPCLLDWATRYRIALGTAKALAYLHDVKRIVHRDVKASNILLDSQFEPKVADFGLSKMFEREQTRVVTKVRGSPGYVDPAYLLSGELTMKSDVYSFGVVVMELLTGLAPASGIADKMAPLMKQAMREGVDVSVVLDRRLGAGYDAGQVKLMMRCAEACTRKKPAERPTMAEVVALLDQKK